MKYPLARARDYSKVQCMNQNFAMELTVTDPWTKRLIAWADKDDKQTKKQGKRK